MMIKLDVNDECKVSIRLGIEFSAFQSFPRLTLENSPRCIISSIYFRNGSKNKDRPLGVIFSYSGSKIRRLCMAI